MILLSIGAAAMGLYPALLFSTTNHAHDLTIYNSGSSSYALTAGLIWGGIGLLLAAGYSAFAHYKFRGRVPAPEAQNQSASQGH